MTDPSASAGERDRRRLTAQILSDAKLNFSKMADLIERPNPNISEIVEGRW
jgi:hypothetical protein